MEAKAGQQVWQWWEFSPYEIGPLVSRSTWGKSNTGSGNGGAGASRADGSGGGTDALEATPRDEASGVDIGNACPSWAFGRRFQKGVSVDVVAGGEHSLGLLLGVFGAAFCISLDRLWELEGGNLPNMLASPLHALVDHKHGAHIMNPPTFHDYRNELNEWWIGPDATQTEPESVVALADAGIDSNFPLPPVQRAEREVDVHIVLDFSEYEPEFTSANMWNETYADAARRGAPMPIFDHNALSSQPVSVFPGDPASSTPTLIVLHLKAFPEAATDPSVAGTPEATLDPLRIAQNGGFTALMTPKYTAEQFDDLGGFVSNRLRRHMPLIKSALLDHYRRKVLARDSKVAKATE